MNNPDQQAALRQIIDDLLGEFHQHKCGTCNGTNGGCINCRKTGMDQTPCPICDKAGVAFKRKQEAVEAIAPIIQEAERRAVDNVLWYLDTHHNLDRYQITGAGIPARGGNFYHVAHLLRDAKKAALQPPKEDTDHE